MVRFLGHHAPHVLVALVAALLVLALAPIPPAVNWAILLCLLFAVLGLAGALLSHSRRLCERCIAAVPLNASAAASRYKRRFRIVHLFERKLLAIGYLAAVVGTSFLYLHPLGVYVWAAAQASLGYLLLVYVSHQRLQPWCPYCRNGGEEQHTPTTPTPVSSTR